MSAEGIIRLKLWHVGIVEEDDGRRKWVRTGWAPPLKQGTKLLVVTQGSGSKLKSSPSPSMRSLMMLSMSHSRFSIYISRSRS